MNERQDHNISRERLGRKPLGRAAVAMALGKRTDAAEIIKITRLLNNCDPVVRQDTIKKLAQIRGPDAILAISRCLRDSDPQVRATACKTLGRMRAQSAKAQLYDALHDSNDLVCCSAAEALAKMGDNIGLTQIKKLVCTSDRYRWQALRTLNILTNNDFRINEQGLKEAIQWIKAVKPKKKRFFNF